jgi:hypothetical protein
MNAKDIAQPDDDGEWHPHLRPDGRVEQRLRGAMGWLLAYPWFDRLSLWALVHYFFPLSRMWAAAACSSGVPERFFEQLEITPEGIDLDRLQAVLLQVESARATTAAVDQRWEQAFFGPEPRTDQELVSIETARLDQRHKLNSLRKEFRFMRRAPIAVQKAAPPTVEEVEAAYGQYRDDRAPLFAAPDPMPEVDVSRRVPGNVGTDYWLRFRSPQPRLNDMVYARVHEPEGVENPPTLVFGHGICVDFDHWRGLIDEVDALCRMGVRVIRHEAPFHGRRRPAGRYPGEAIVATTPMGPLDSFSGSIREWSVLLDWARKTSTGPIAVGGSSLGALTSLLCADVARYWPKEIQPQALLLITHSGHQRDALVNGALAEVWKARDAMEKVGWSAEMAADYIRLLDPSWDDAPVVESENIISILGSYDHVTPYKSGIELLNAWGVPVENRFLWKRGHFSVPMTMIRNDKPLKAFVDILTRLQHSG